VIWDQNPAGHFTDGHIDVMGMMLAADFQAIVRMRMRSCGAPEEIWSKAVANALKHLGDDFSIEATEKLIVEAANKVTEL
jgi:fructose-1,6-bisphosphatase/sedoheptulose 1,7-bisphosphatase-like protein